MIAHPPPTSPAGVAARFWRRSRTNDAIAPVPRIAAMIGRLISGPILPTISPSTILTPMNASSAASAVLR